MQGHTPWYVYSRVQVKLFEAVGFLLFYILYIAIAVAISYLRVSSLAFDR